MKMSDIIDEHNKIPEQNFPKPILDDAKIIGKISLKNGSIADVYYKNWKNQFQYIACIDNNVIGFVTLVSIPSRQNLYMAKNAQSWIAGQNVLLNLLLFIKKSLNARILSDVEMSDSGEESWFRIIKNPRVDSKIYNFDQDKTYDINDPAAIKPENNANQNIDNINWFYMIESNISKKYENDIINGLCLPNYYD